MKRILGVLLLSFLCAEAQAGGSAVGVITTYWTGVQNGQEILLVYFGSVSNPASCTGGSSNRFIYSASQPNYKSVLATVISAYFSGTSIYAQGAGVCDIWSTTEDLAYVCPGVGVGGC